MVPRQRRSSCQTGIIRPHDWHDLAGALVDLGDRGLMDSFRKSTPCRILAAPAELDSALVGGVDHVVAQPTGPLTAEAAARATA